MREIIKVVKQWIDADKKVAVATVVKIYGSAPRGLGAKMAVNEAGEMVGSVSGGCVEGAVIGEALTVIKNQKACLLHYGVTNEQAFSVGLACGGEIEVFVEPVDPAWFTPLYDDLTNQRYTALVKVIRGEPVGAMLQAYPDGQYVSRDFPEGLLDSTNRQLKSLFAAQQCGRFSYPKGEETIELFYDLLLPDPKLVIVGAVHIAIPLVHFAKQVGFQTIVVDPRKAFATEERFAHADQLVRVWPQDYFKKYEPDEGTYVVTVSHDEKLDVPALGLACESKAHYIGALGSKKTFAGYRQQMLDNGVDEFLIKRIYSPVGLDIGARGPEEIALAIISEVVKKRNAKL